MSPNGNLIISLHLDSSLSFISCPGRAGDQNDNGKDDSEDSLQLVKSRMVIE